MLALLKRHPIASSAFLLAAVLTLYFTVKLIAGAIYWADPAHRNQPPAGWMTPGYISHSWKVDNKELRQHLGMRKEEIEGRPTLKRIAEAKGVPLSVLIEDVNAFLESRK